MIENSNRTVHFNEYFRVIRNRLWVVFTIFALTVGSGIYITQEVLPKVYTATAQIQIEPRGQSWTPGMIEGNPDKNFDMINFQADFQIMQSADVLMPIVSDLGLDRTWAARLLKSNDPLPPIAALRYMKGILNVDFERGTNIIDVKADSQVPQEAADIANAVVDRYKSVRDVEADKRNGSGIDALHDQINQQQEVVDKAKAAVEKLRTDFGLSLPPNGQQGTTDNDETALEQRERDLLNAKMDADSRRVLMESVNNLPDDEFVDTLSALGRQEPNIATLRAQSLQIDGDITNLKKQGFEENHPRIQSLRAQMDTIHEQLKQLIAGTRRAIIVDSQMAKSRVDLLTQEVETLKEKTIKEQGSQLAPYRDALHEYEKQQSILDAYSIRLKQLMADRQQMESPVRIISRASPPDFPSRPNKNLNTAISVGAGLFIGVVVAFLIEYLDTSVKTMADAESLLGLPVLTVIPNKGGPMPLVQQAARLPHAEGYRILRAKLDLKVQNGLGPSLTMLSGGPGEGKSTTIYNLAVVCAQAGQSVILVDCDLRRPTLHELLNVPNDRGIANFLRGEGDAVEFVQETVIPKLHILTAGDMPMSEIGALAGDKIRYMLDDLKQRYDLVLVDAPPVLGISDGSIIAREVDYVILVIQHRRYPREISLRAKRAIEEVHGNCVGMVLNCVAVKSDDSYYYYSNYGNYYKKADRAKKRSPPKKVEGKNGKALVTANRKSDLSSEEF